MTENTSKPQLDTESIVWDREHTVSATKFLWFDKNNNLEVAQYWQNHMRWQLLNSIGHIRTKFLILHHMYVDTPTVPIWRSRV